jgi:hypothetical protein
VPPDNSQKETVVQTGPEPIQEIASTQPTLVRVIEPAPAPHLVSARSIPAAGRLSGRVVLLGTPPAERLLPLDPQCAVKMDQAHRPKTTQFYLVGKDRGLADVVVSLTGASATQRDGRTNLIAQQACWFTPYISAVQTGDWIVVRNNDDLLNPLVLDSHDNSSFHQLLKKRGSFAFKLDHAEEFVRIRSESNPFQFAYVSVFDHPYFAVTDKNGEFVIADIPPGRYTVQAQHRKAGATKQEVTIEANRNSDVQFVLNVPGTQTASLQ